MPDSQAKKDWKRAHTSNITLSLNHNTDPDIIKRLETVTNRTAYIKQLIRDDIAKQSK